MVYVAGPVPSTPRMSILHPRLESSGHRRLLWTHIRHVHSTSHAQWALAECLMEPNKNITLTTQFFLVDSKPFLSAALSFVSLIKNGNNPVRVWLQDSSSLSGSPDKF